MNRRDFLKMMGLAGAAAILPAGAMEALAERPFDANWGDISGAARFGDILATSSAPGIPLNLPFFSEALKGYVERAELLGDRVRGWEWVTRTPNGFTDPLDQRYCLGVKIYVHGYGEGAR